MRRTCSQTVSLTLLPGAGQEMLKKRSGGAGGGGVKKALAVTGIMSLHCILISPAGPSTL